ncbi:MAG: single-stranded-DNA-specific exonuclease RecJ [Vicinamibacterales bacterium]|nr:single-stranded-DNA-specific exonuclease RecJ [Vicinamibacterales bacterium]
MVPYVWECASHDDAGARRLAEAVRVDPMVGRLLWQRGLTDPEAAHRFLHPTFAHLHDPLRLADMGRAVDRLLAAVARGERMAVHGDYDVDGITSTVIVRRVLELLGGDVGHFVPERIRDGYGLNIPAIERLHAEGARVIVSVDCGIRGAEAARRARELGIDLIITDHHEPDVSLPDAFAVINPKRPDCTYPDKDLAGVGVALKLVQALCTRTGHDRWVTGFIKLAALGTLADVVPLLGENRVIASLGLDALSHGPHKAGLRALLEVCGLYGKRVESQNVAFMLAPRLNAAGRMSTPDLALRLLLASDDSCLDEARALAEQLNRENERRQQEERGMVVDAKRLVDGDPDIGARSVLVVAGDGWHRGVIGIVASKLVETYHRPAVVLAIDGETAHGSCRSIPGFDMLAALEGCAPLLERFGGHKMAAGLTLARSRIKAFRAAVATIGDDRLTPDDLRPTLRLDAPLGFRAITDRFYEDLGRLAPFGMANPRPLFFARGAAVTDGPRRLKERHLSVGLRHEGVVLRALYWRGAERERLIAGARESLDVAFTVEQNTFNGRSTLELSLADVTAGSGAA